MVKAEIMKSKIKIIFLLTFVLISCDRSHNQEGKYADSRKVYDEAINIHDEVMPLMGEIMQLQKNLKIEKEKINDAQQKVEINEVLQKLEDAHNSMMIWMRTITSIPESKEGVLIDSSGLPAANEMLEIQKSSLKSVKIVKELILSSIEEGNKLLESL
jgi:hypothetical protein